MIAAFKDVHDAASVLLSVAINAANNRVSVDAVERGADGLPPSFGAVLVAKSVLLGACWLREGLSEVPTAIEAASDDTATVIEAAIGNLDATLVGIDSEIAANGRQLNERLRGVEVLLEVLLEELRNRPTKGTPCRRGT